MKKLQVFISSTFIDLQEERQAAVEAVLAAGHIPAGMELFKAGNESQLDTIKRWIDESDIYMLILGARYGSIETISGKSYTHLEYEYALSKGIPVFAVILTDEAIQKKVKILGTKAIETDYGIKYKEFKDSVLKKISRFVNDEKDIKLALLETISDLQQRYNFNGWVSGKDIPNTEKLYKEIVRLTTENQKLNQSIQKINQKQVNCINGLSYDELAQILSQKEIRLPGQLFNEENDYETNFLHTFEIFGSDIAVGVTNASNADFQSRFVFYNVAPELIIYGLIEEKKLTGKSFQKRQTTKEGNKFLAHLQVQKLLVEKK